MKATTICGLLTVIVIVTGCSDQDRSKTIEFNPPAAAVEKYAPDIKVSDLVGNWKAGTGVAKIEGSDESALSITTETGTKGVGAIHGDRIDVPSWNVVGKLTVDRKHIRWSNNFVWDR